MANSAWDGAADERGLRDVSESNEPMNASFLNMHTWGALYEIGPPAERRKRAQQLDPILRRNTTASRIGRRSRFQRQDSRVWMDGLETSRRGDGGRGLGFNRATQRRFPSIGDSLPLPSRPCSLWGCFS